MDKDTRRRLTDLYARGEELTINDQVHEPFVFWIRKMTPADAEVSYLKANAKRASILSQGKQDPPPDGYLSLKAEVERLPKSNLIDWVVASDMVSLRPQVEARVGYDDEWNKERYLDSLQERVMQPDFLRKEEETPEDEEVTRVRGELERFHLKVVEETEKEEKRVRNDKEILSETELQEAVIDSMLESQADGAWLTEFQRCQAWRCTYFNDDRSERVFLNRDDVDGVQVELLAEIMGAVDRVHVNDFEGKDLQQTPDSSQPSE